MRFDYLDLEAFGHFTNYKLLFDTDQNFHLLYGQNEAGKSTILRAVSNLLYGFPQQTADSFLHDNQKLRIGGQLTNQNGETLTFTRRKGIKNTVLDSNGQAIDEKELYHFLEGMSEEQFLNMFALDHVRLREGGESLLNSDGNAGESLFSAASGINVLRDVLNEFEKKARDLYLKSGSKPLINQELKAEKELSKQIAENQLKIQAWKDLEQSYLDGANRIEKLKEKLQFLATKEAKYRRLKQTLPKIALRQETIDKRNKLIDVPDLSERAEEDRKENLQQLELAQNKKKDALDKIDQIKSDLEKLSIPTGILEQEAKIEALNREVDSYQKDRKQLPILIGEQRQLEQQVLSALKEIDARNDRIDNVVHYRISAEKKKSIRELSDRYPLIEQDRKNADKDVESINKELSKQIESLTELGEPVDIDALEQAINQVKIEGKMEDELKKMQEQIIQLNQEIDAKIARLSLWDGPSEELARLQVPSLTNTVKKYRKENQTLTDELKQIKAKIKEQTNSIEMNEAKIRELESLADIPTEEVLAQLRQHRDAGWLVIRNKLNADLIDDSQLEAFTGGLPLDLAFEKSISQSDDTADVMRREAEKLGEKNKLNADIKVGNQNLALLKTEQTNCELSFAKWKEDWENEWRPAEIKPLSPEEMIEWLENYHLIVALIAEQAKVANQAKQLREKCDQLTASLRAALAVIENVPEDSTLKELVDQAEKRSKALTEKESSRKHVQKLIKDLKDKHDQAIAEKEVATDEMQQWKEAWDKALNGQSFSGDTAASVVKELLETYDACVRDFDKLKLVEEEIKTTEERIKLFGEKVKMLDYDTTQEFDEMAMDVAVTQFYQILNLAKQDKVKLESLQQQARDSEKDQQVANDKIVEANANLTKLMEKAMCETLEELEEVEVAFKQKQLFTEKISELEEDILEVGNGLTLEKLLDEAAEIEVDLIDNELDEIDRERNDLDSTRSVVEQEHGVVKKDYNQKIEGTNFASVQAAEEKQSVLAKIADHTDQYVNQKLASLLLKRGIEYYREQNQSPIIDRASQIFHRLTLHSFDGITVDFDEKDQPVIMGVRNDDKKINVAGMSDGTTDQLYLALRIASIEKYISENEPIPFIVDDILVHFDDERSKETLKVLLELSKKTQVIFFTHHSRLLELINEVTEETIYQQIEVDTNKPQVITR